MTTPTSETQIQTQTQEGEESGVVDASTRENVAGSRLSIGFLSEIRKRVSRDRVRYNDGKFDLDLTYITDQIIGSSPPSLSSSPQTQQRDAEH